MTQPSTWYSLRRKTAIAAAALGVASAAEISIYGDIGESWYDETVSAASFVRDLAALDVDAITVRINSIGGSVPDGLAIFNAMRRHKAKITTEIDGMAFSIASLIAMGGDVVRMASNAMLMIHAPWTYASGNSTELRELADQLDTWAAAMSTSYAIRTGDQPGMLALLTDGKDHYYTADEALAAKFIDAVTDALPVAASAVRDLPLSRYRSLPASLQSTPQAHQRTAMTPEEIRAAAARDEGARRTAIRNSFAPFASASGVAELLRQCEDDTSLTPQAAGTRLLAHLARDQSPIAGSAFNDGGAPSARFGADDRMGDFRAAAIDALLIRSGIRVERPHPQAADLRRVGIVGMAERVLSMQGKSASSMSRDQIIRAALSTSDFPTLLSGLSTASLRRGYLEAPATHAGWTGEREVADFLPRSLAMLSAAPALDFKAEGAEYKAGYFSESAEKFIVKTYGKLVPITREALINDQLDAFTSIPNTQGAAARRLEADMVYAKLVANSAMNDGKALFHADHGNLAASGSALSIDSLGAARAAMRKQKGLAGEFIDPQPRYLIVPVALETKAEQLLNSTVDPAKANNTDNLEWVRRLVLVADPRLDAASDTAWYLAADPRQVEGIVRAYIEGEARPFLDHQQEWLRDVMNYKVRLDLGVGVIDWRGLYKNPGA